MDAGDADDGVPEGTPSLPEARRRHGSGDVAGAWQVCAELADRARATGDTGLLAAAALVVHRPEDLLLRARVHALAREALARVPADDPRRPGLLAQVGATRNPHHPQALEADPHDLADPEAAFLALQAEVASLQHPSHVERRLALADRALALGLATGVAEYRAWGRRWRMDAAAELGLPVELGDERAAVVALVEDLGGEWPAWLLLTRASTKLLEGAFSEASRLVDEARAAGPPDGAAAFFHLVFASELAGWTGQDAARVADDVARATEDLPFLARGWLATARHHAGDDEAARHLWNGIRGHVARMPEDAPEWLMGAVVNAELCEAFGDTEVAAELHARLLPYADLFAISLCHTPNHGPVSLALGRLALVLGRTDEAREHLTRALGAAVGVQALPHAALAHLALARSYSSGSRGRAEHAAAAADLARSLGALPLLARAEALGERPSGDPRLTPREAEVAALVAEGLTNSAIAGRLVLSERTVENHVAHVLHKLHLPTRAALAARMGGGPRTDERNLP